MDRVRFGRVLGFGARQAAKTLVAAVDAATAENPSAQSTTRSTNATPTRTTAVPLATSSTRPARPASNPPAADMAARSAAQRTTSTVLQAREMQQKLGSGGRRLGEALWKPFVRLSGVLWLEVSGVFFGLFALVALSYIWRLRGAWRATAGNAVNHRSLIGATVMLVLFGYFCVSNFVRARRRERGQ